MAAGFSLENRRRQFQTLIGYITLQKTILPKDEWTKYEEGKLYLSPIVDQVKKERDEREQWEKEY